MLERVSHTCLLLTYAASYLVRHSNTLFKIALLNLIFELVSSSPFHVEYSCCILDTNFNKIIGIFHKTTKTNYPRTRGCVQYNQRLVTAYHEHILLYEAVSIPVRRALYVYFLRFKILTTFVFHAVKCTNLILLSLIMYNNKIIKI